MRHITINLKFVNGYTSLISNFISKIPNKSIYINNNTNDICCNIKLNENIKEFVLQSLHKSILLLDNHNTTNTITISDIYKWNICVFSNIMFDFPFTIDNIIFLPIKTINHLHSSNNTTSLVNLLIHEKIHIDQRYNLNKWKQFIQINNPSWKFIDNFDQNYFSQFNTDNSIHIFNPDTFYNFYFSYNDNLGALFIDNNNNVNTLWFDSNNKKNNSHDLPDHEHPFEIYAYQISNNLTMNF